MRQLCDEIADAIADATDGVLGPSAAGADVVGQGADGTPTKRLDRIAEDAALDVVERHGDLRVVSEEAGSVAFGDPERTLVLDPVDGTYNAGSGIPHYAVSIAIADGDDVADVEYGYVRDLVTGTTFAAAEGDGATRDGTPLEVTDVDDRTAMALGGVYNIEGFDPARFRRVRLLGCSSLELCYTAAGALDAFVDLRARLRVVDFAAGALIVEEAGGVVTDEDGEPVTGPVTADHRSSLVAGGPASHETAMAEVER
jgi:myo-inositol-1(or 4)-monophosphatase